MLSGEFGAAEALTATPALSVVVPFYAVEDYIGDCLESLRQQTLRDMEIICVDDGSTDASLLIAEAYASVDSRFRVVRQENQGLGPARNTGASHARGRYLAFVDSDDLVAPRAYSRLVNSLETTNSLIAAGNTLRFTRKGYVTQSWAHRRAFSATRRGTSIFELPELADDRMVWNKVYRRDFWEAGGFKFPAIRYEDYPVTLPAYLAADSVDVLSDHVYFWRIRGGGTSITQQSLRLDNLRDRYASDVMVLEALGDEHLSAIARRVHTQFVDVDLMTFAEALVAGDREAREEVWAMASHFARLLEPVDRGGRRYFADSVHAAILAGDVRQTEMLARWRTTRNAPGLLRDMVTHPTPLHLEILKNSALDQVKRRRIKLSRRLRVHLEKIEATPQGIVISVRPQLNQRIQGVAGVSMVLHGRDRTIELPVVHHVGDDGDLRISGTISDQFDGLLPQTNATYGLSVSLGLGPAKWKGQVLVDDVEFPGALRAQDGTVVQAVAWYVPQAYGDCLRFSVLHHPTLITDVDIDETGFNLHLGRAVTGTLTVHFPHPTPDVHVSVDEGVGRLNWDQMTQSPVFDDPVTGRANRDLTFVDLHGRRTWLTLACPSPRIVKAGVEVSLRPNREGHAVLHAEQEMDRSFEAATEVILPRAGFLSPAAD